MNWTPTGIPSASNPARTAQAGQPGEVLGHRVAHHQLAEFELLAEMLDPLLADHRRRARAHRREQQVDLGKRAMKAGAQPLAAAIPPR